MRFILLDRIVDLAPGHSIVAAKTLPAGEELFRDHFPGFPVVPGVLLTEMMGQAAGKCLDAERTHSGRAMLGEIRNARFREWVRPDQEILLHAEITQNRDRFALARCRAEVEGREVSSAELMFVFAPQAQTPGGDPDPLLEAYYESKR